MRRFFYSILFSLSLFLFSFNLALAHPPSSISLKYDPTKKILSISIQHITQHKHKRDHYIKNLTVTQNDKKVFEDLYVWQENEIGLDKDVDLDAKAGDIITVEAVDNHGGSKKETLTITK